VEINEEAKRIIWCIGFIPGAGLFEISETQLTELDCMTILSSCETDYFATQIQEIIFKLLKIL
jgi:hypothetical protein